MAVPRAAAAVAGYEVAGKTGTAQENEKRPNHALFVGYAPADSPQIAIATRIAYGYGSSNACVFVDQVLKYYFKQNTEEELLNGQATNVGSSSIALVISKAEYITKDNR